MLEYKSMLIDGPADRLLNAQAVDGWTCFAVTQGGYSSGGKFMHMATCLWFNRERKTAEQRTAVRAAKRR